MDEKYKGTTVNERLYLSGKFDAFDKAVAERNIDEVKLILKEVELGDENINSILSQ